MKYWSHRLMQQQAQSSQIHCEYGPGDQVPCVCDAGECCGAVLLPVPETAYFVVYAVIEWTCEGWDSTSSPDVLVLALCLRRTAKLWRLHHSPAATWPASPKTGPSTCAATSLRNFMASSSIPWFGAKQFSACLAQGRS